MSVSLSVVMSDIILLLNAGSPGAYSAVVTDPRWNTQQVVDAILTADGWVCAATFRNVLNARSSLYYSTQSGLAHGATVANTAGPVVAVRFVVTGGTAPGTRPGIDWDLAEITHEINDPLSLSYDPHYSLQGRKIFHNGSRIAAASGGGTVSIEVDFPTFTQTSACQAADEYRWAVICGGMAQLVPVEGENLGITGGWAQQFQYVLGEISKGEGVPPQSLERILRERLAA